LVFVDGCVDVVEFRSELLGWFGFCENVSDVEVETVYNGLVEFFELALYEVKFWVVVWIIDVDEAFVFLFGLE